MFIKKDKLSGVTALITVISLGSLIFFISLSTAVLTFWSIKNIDANQKGLSAYYAAYSGIQDALIKLERNKDYSGEYYLSINNTNDVTVIVSNTGDGTTIYSEAVIGEIHKRIETTADIDSTTGLITPIETKEVVISDIPSWACGDDVTFIYKNEQVTYGTIESAGGECWLNRNLGASRVATAYNDSEAYGDLFQWGRLDDGHQNRNSGTTDILSSEDDPGHSNFIKAPDEPYDWRNPQNDNLWQGVNGINNPCPPDWRIPTKDEWGVELDSWFDGEYYDAYASPLKLTLPGYRHSWFDGIDMEGTFSWYWSSTVDGNIWAWYLWYDGWDAFVVDADRAIAGSVRCIKD